MMPPTARSIVGMETANTTDNGGFRRIAITKAAIIMPGARRAMRSIIPTKFCTCVMSFVSLVTSEPVENLSMFAKEYCWILR